MMPNVIPSEARNLLVIGSMQLKQIPRGRSRTSALGM